MSAAYRSARIDLDGKAYEVRRSPRDGRPLAVLVLTDRRTHYQAEVWRRLKLEGELAQRAIAATRATP